MVRVILVAVLSISAVACKSKGDGANVGVAAGKVIEVEGDVQVRHGEAVRPLAIGETVDADDTIVTGADGRAKIELRHNLAQWDVPPNKSQRVKTSIAWNLPRNTGTGKPGDQAIAAAGRPAEKSAADTTVSAEPVPAADTTPAAAGADRATADMPEEEAKQIPPGRAAAAPAAAPAPPPTESAPPPMQDRVKKREDRMRTNENVERPTDDVVVSPLGLIGVGAGGGGTSTGGGLGKGGGSRPKPPVAAAPARMPSIGDQVVRERAAIAACLTKVNPAVSISVTVDEAGKVAVVVKSKVGVSPAVQSCVIGAVQKIKFIARGATATVEIAK